MMTRTDARSRRCSAVAPPTSSLLPAVRPQEAATVRWPAPGSASSGDFKARCCFRQEGHAVVRRFPVCGFALAADTRPCLAHGPGEERSKLGLLVTRPTAVRPA